MSPLDSSFSRLIGDRRIRRALPGYVATALIIVVTLLWTFWSVGELYYEGWWGPWHVRLTYLIPGGLCLLLTLIALTWPRVGGWLIIIIGAAFTAWWLGPRLRSGLEIGQLLVLFPLSGMLVVIGVLFLFEGRHRRLSHKEGWTPRGGWLRRNARYVAAVGLPLIVVVGWSVYWLPVLLSRHDDGERGARTIVAHGATLVWAPEGPGWNWKQEWGGYPSWDHLALYGVRPVGLEDKPGYEDGHASAVDMAVTGLCRYLSADGSNLISEAQNIWRLPTTDELIGSLTRHGENVTCVREHALTEAPRGRASCDRTPDKETPLWAPDRAPISYWSADEFDADRAYFVSYNGAFNVQPKSWGNPRHSHRCVREP